MLQSRTLLGYAKQFRLSPAVFQQQLETFYQAFDCPRSLTCLILLRNGEYDQLVRLETVVSDYLDFNSFYESFIVTSYLRKAEFLKTGINKKAAALEAFKASEEHCRAVNLRFKDLTFDPLYKGQNVALLHAMSRKIAMILEPFKFSAWKELLNGAAFGPGSSYHIRGGSTGAERKFREELGTTAVLHHHFWKRRKRLYPHWFNRANVEPAAKLQEASQVTTVPKNAKTDRTIAIEPGLNIWFQKAVGSMLRRRLREHGYDLNSDARNQRGAYLGSKFNNLATVDMKAASDTIAYQMVREILPHDWFEVLDALRSREYELESSTFRFEKFSSMGNGFTFELESTIFLTAALAACEFVGAPTTDVAIFGDDVVLPVEAFDTFRSFCSFLGFVVNVDKTYVNSPFRESCGTYFYNGIECKPIFLKKRPTRIGAYYAYTNSVRMLAHRLCLGFGCDRRLLRSYRLLIKTLPPALRLKGSYGFGDVFLHSNLDEANPSVIKNDRRTLGWEGFRTPGLVPTPVTYVDASEAVLTAHLHKGGLQAGNNISPARFTRLRRKTLIVHQWYNFGPWI